MKTANPGKKPSKLRQMFGSRFKAGSYSSTAGSEKNSSTKSAYRSSFPCLYFAKKSVISAQASSTGC